MRHSRRAATRDGEGGYAAFADDHRANAKDRPVVVDSYAAQDSAIIDDGASGHGVGAAEHGPAGGVGQLHAKRLCTLKYAVLGGLHVEGLRAHTSGKRQGLCRQGGKVSRVRRVRRGRCQC